MISINEIVQRSSDQMFSDISQEKPEIVVLNTQNNHYFGLEEVAGRVWQLLTEPRKVSEIVELIISEYEVDALQCEADIIDFLNQLENSGLLVIVSR